MEAIERHGEKPVIQRCENWREELQQLQKMIADFRKSERSSLAIITKTNNDARTLYDALPQACGIHLLSLESDRFTSGVSVLSVSMSKGLEFDEVVIVDVDSRSYAAEYDRKLLYIACTRAMHRLTLMYVGEQSGLIEG